MFEVGILLFLGHRQFDAFPFAHMDKTLYLYPPEVYQLGPEKLSSQKESTRMSMEVIGSRSLVSWVIFHLRIRDVSNLPL